MHDGAIQQSTIHYCNWHELLLTENSREGEIQIEKNPVYGIEGTRPLQQNNFDPDDYEVV